MLPWAKFLREPRKPIFYGLFYLAALRPGRRARVAMLGAGHTRPNLTWKIFRLLALREVAAGAPADLAYYHEDETRVSGAAGALNGRCTDIGKARVAAVWEASAGYALAVDPTRWTGPMMSKSDANATHDGRLEDGPVLYPEPGRAYQRLIDNRVTDGEIMDIRPCVIGDEIAFCYLRYRPIASRFPNENNRVVRVAAATMLSADEVALVLRFARAIGLDVGEIDILRDRTDGRIYAVDVSKTPHSPGDYFLNARGFGAMRLAAAAFRRQFLSRPRR